MKHILVTREDAEKAMGFLDNDNCIIATALKRKFPKARIRVYGFSLKVDGVEYDIVNHGSPHRKFYKLGDTKATRLKKFKPFIVKVRETAY